MKLKSAVFLVLVAVACLSLSSWVLAVEPPRNETLIADILTGKVETRELQFLGYLGGQR